MSRAQVDHANLTVTVNGVTYAPRFDFAILRVFEQSLGRSAMLLEPGHPTGLRYPDAAAPLFLFFMCGGEEAVKMDDAEWYVALTGHTLESIKTFVYLVARRDVDGTATLGRGEGGVN